METVRFSLNDQTSSHAPVDHTPAKRQFTRFNGFISASFGRQPVASTTVRRFIDMLWLLTDST